MGNGKIPIIVDTDIGGDIDDAWALSMMLCSPELDIKLIVTSVGDTFSRAKIVAKMLEAAGRSDIPIAIGLPEVEMSCYCDSWANNYDLASYRGKVYQSDEAVRAVIGAVNNCEREPVVLALAPLTNIAAVLDADPGITSRSRLVGMLGSIYKGYNGAKEPSQECNIVNNIPAAKKVFSSDWDMTITPLDTCGLVKLTGENYSLVRNSRKPLIKALIENYDTWLKRPGYPAHPYASLSDINIKSSTLFDTVAVYLAICEELVNIETLPLKVTDDGYTIVEEGGKMIRCPTSWKKMSLFENLLTQRLTKSTHSVEKSYNLMAALSREER